uniref:Poly [ADP-ribose] polymerase n=1 Tax=Oreochromis niloticus TaxID=8128 RepID=A0A669AX18_ORENI
MQPPLPPEAVRELVCSCLQRDPVAADLRCSLFVAATQNYKRDSLLRPFPPRYLSGDNKEFEELLADVNSLPGVRELVRLRPGEADHHLALAHWILSSKSFAVKTLQKEEYAKLCSLTENEGMSAPVPDFLFELEYSDQMNARFERTREGRDVFYAFHGSRLENFHSIIHNGLHCHLNKVSVPKPYFKCFFTDQIFDLEEQGEFKRMLKGWSVNQSDTLCLHGHVSLQNSVFGEGTYLTSDLSMAVLYSPHSSGWRESILGPLLSCVALCEVIDHPDVKCQVKKKDSEVVDRQRSRAKNSEGGDVPHKYFVVTNNQLLRVKYLLVYSQRRHLSRHSRSRSWLLRHHFAIMMSLYLLLLIFIGALNSNTFVSFWNRLFR